MPRLSGVPQRARSVNRAHRAGAGASRTHRGSLPYPPTGKLTSPLLPAIVIMLKHGVGCLSISRLGHCVAKVQRALSRAFRLYRAFTHDSPENHDNRPRRGTQPLKKRTPNHSGGYVASRPSARRLNCDNAYAIGTEYNQGANDRALLRKARPRDRRR